MSEGNPSVVPPPLTVNLPAGDEGGDHKPPASPDQTLHPDGTPASPPKDGEGDGEKSQNRTPAAARIRELTEQRRTTEAENAGLKARLAELERKVGGDGDQGGGETPPDTPPKRPRRSDFKTDAGEFDAEQYDDALDDYYEARDRQAEARYEAAERVRQEEADRRAAASEAQEADRVIEAGRELYPDYDEVILAASNSTGELVNAAISTAFEKPIAARVAYHLAQNPAEATRLQQLEASGQNAQALLELGRLAGRVQGGLGTRPGGPAPPPDSVDSGGEGDNGLGEALKSQSAFNAYYDKHLARKY